MARALVPIATLYNYEHSIFDGFYSKGISKEDMINHFILSFGDLTPVYQKPSMLKMHIASVAKSLQWSIDHLWEVTQLEYNPIENYDRYEHWTDHKDGTFDKGDVNTNGTYQKGTVTDTVGQGQTDTHSVAAFNSNTAQLASVDEVQQKGTNTTAYGADSTSGTQSFDTDKSVDDSVHDGRIHGNIGVTTSQKMIESEIKLTRYNYMDQVCEMYAQRLLIGVW